MADLPEQINDRVAEDLHRYLPFIESILAIHDERVRKEQTHDQAQK